MELVARESSFNSNAANPKSSAKGLFQFLNMTRANKAYNKGITDWSDPYQQAIAGLRYIKSKYKTPEKALKFWDENKSY
jgi:SLT domain-containing protein